MPVFLQNLLSVLRWQDVLDILLNSYLLFRLYIILRGTRLFLVVIIIFLLLIVQQIVSSASMILTHTVLQGIAALTAIGVLIVFRYEIRSMFQTKGIKDILWRVSTKPVVTPVEIIATSVYQLARKKIGALIVLPGRQPVEAAIQNSVAWNGQVSRQMIESIFWPDNPVHDGAAVIRGNRIDRVAAILPLTERTDLPMRYGTRHRAAIGLTERSDALVVIVSEERGEVTLAHTGQIEPVKDAATLEKRLRRHTGMSVDTPQRAARERRSAAVAFMLSLIVVGSVWYSFSLGFVRSLTTVEVPIEYIRSDSRMEIIESSSSSVRIQLSGSLQLINRLDPSQIRVRLDISKAVAGLNSFTITEDDVLLPPGTSLKKVEPNTIEIMVDTLGEKTLPVQVDWTGKLPPDILIQDVRLEPATVDVIGGQLLLEGIDTIYTAKVPVDGLKQSGEVRVALALVPASLRLTTDQENSILVTYRVRPSHPIPAP
jgi:diadenylate cyclase